MRKLIAFTILFFAFATTLFGKGCSGTYFIKGKAYAADKTVLKNDTLTLKFGDEIQTIVTDNEGNFKIRLHWSNACPSNRSKEQHKRDNEKLNPPFIYISRAGKEIKLENNWEKYAECFPKSEKKVTKREELRF